MNRGLLLALLAALAVALALRVPQLADRPLHNDEAVNTIKFRALWEKGGYRYDPNEHHGPTLFYATLAWLRLTGAPGFVRMGEADFRWVTVLFGVGLILLLPLLADGLGRGGTAAAAGLTAVSPAFVFYSRYFIHEMLLVWCTLLLLAAAWRYHRRPHWGWAVLAGAGLGLMQATKETFVLNLAAMAAGIAANWLWVRWTAPPGAPRPTPLATLRALVSPAHLAAAAGVTVLVAVVLFSSFFTNASGPLDSFRTYLPWVNRAAGASPHLHPWNYYLEHLLWFHPKAGHWFSEAFIAGLAVVGAATGFRRRTAENAEPDSGLIRFLAVYTLVLTVLYCGIAYKTPWCLLGFWHGAVLLAGVGAAAWWRAARPVAGRVALALALAAGTAHLAWQAWQLDTVYATDRRNPYIYSQTSESLLELVDLVRGVAATAAEGDHLRLKVMAPDSDYWPLPWYLRQFDQIGWFDGRPADPAAPIAVAATKLDVALDDQKTHFMVGIFELRPQVFLQLYVRRDLWNQYLAKRPKPAE